MPAIQLARLRQQVGLIRDSYFQPEVFVRQLRQLLEFYANTSHRRGKSGEPTPLIQTYNVPFPVIRQVLQDVSPLVDEHPHDAMLLIDRLWKEESLESKTIAINILALLPTDVPNEIINRVKSWLPESEERISNLLLSKGLTRIRREARPHFISMVNTWMKSADSKEQQIGLRALVDPLDDEEFEDIPTLFRLLTPAVRNINPIIKQDLVMVFKALAHKSPKETTYFLRQNMPFQDVPWLVRKIIKELPEDMQKNLKKAMKNPLPPL
jgi:hypothetical protein